MNINMEIAWRNTVDYAKYKMDDADYPTAQDQAIVWADQQLKTVVAKTRSKYQQQELEIIELLGEVIQAGHAMATELKVCTDAAKEAGCELQEAELALQEWKKITDTSLG